MDAFRAILRPGMQPASSTPIWRRPRAQLYALTVLIWLVVVGVLAAAWDALLPFVLAALAAYVIDPVIERLTRVRLGARTVPRSGAVLAVYAVLATVVYFLAVSVVPQLYREAVRGLLELREFLTGIP